MSAAGLCPPSARAANRRPSRDPHGQGCLLEEREMSMLSFTEARRRVLAIAIGCSGAVLVLCVPAAAAQVPPPTLTGESFAAGLFSPPAGLGSIAVTSATCDPAGSSSFSYQVSGPAAGPYL